MDAAVGTLKFENKAVIPTDPRTKLFLTVTVSTIMITGGTGGFMNLVRPCLMACPIVFLLVAICGKYHCGSHSQHSSKARPAGNPRCRRAGAGENSSSCPFYHRAVWGNTRPFHQPRFCFPGGRQTGPCFFRRPTAAFLLCQTIPWACPSPYPPGHSLETGSRHPGETGFSPSGG